MIDGVYLDLDVVCDSDCMDITADMLISSDNNVYPIYPNTLIVRLKGQKIKLRAFVKTGTGKDHAKWIPVTAIGYSIDNDGVILTIESAGGLSSQEILKQAKELAPFHTSEFNKYKSFFIKSSE